MFQRKVLEKIKTHFMFSNFLSKTVAYEIMWKNMVQQDRLQITIYGTCALHVRLQTHSQNV
jgi:hypothetical protein